MRYVHDFFVHLYQTLLLQTRTGAVACMNLGAQHFAAKDDLLVIAGYVNYRIDYIVTIHNTEHILNNKGTLFL